MELGVSLEGVVQSDEEGRLSDSLQHLPFGLGVFRRLLLLHDGRLLQHLHGVQSAVVHAALLAHQEHLTVRCNRPRSPSEPTHSLTKFHINSYLRNVLRAGRNSLSGKDKTYCNKRNINVK